MKKKLPIFLGIVIVIIYKNITTTAVLFQSLPA